MEREVWCIYFERGGIQNHEFRVLAGSVDEALAEFRRLAHDPDRTRVTHVAVTNAKVNV